MSSFVLRYERLAGWHEWPGRLPEPGEYVTSYDPDGCGGRGVAFFDNRPDHALRFPTAQTARDLVEQTSTVRPVREDGHPNRPLTAFLFNIAPDPLKRPAPEPEPEEPPRAH